MAEISLPFRKEFLIKTAVLYRDQGKNKQAMECLLDTNKGPSILDDDCELKILEFINFVNLRIDFEARRIKDDDSDRIFFAFH